MSVPEVMPAREAEVDRDVLVDRAVVSNAPLLRRLVADSGWMSLVVAVPLVARLAATPIRVRMLTPADFGQVSLWAAAIAVVGGFALWPGTGLMRYLPAGSDRDRAQVLRSWLAATGATAVVATAAFAGWAVHGGWAWGWVAVIISLELAISAASSYTRAVGRFGALCAVSLTGSVGGLIAGTLLISPLGPIGTLVGWALGDLVGLILATILIWQSIVAGLRGGPGWQLGRLVRFSAPLAVSNGTWMLVTWLDRPLLAGLVTRSELGLYSLAYALVAAPLAGLFVVLSSATWNHAVVAFEKDGYPAAAELLRRSARIYTATAVPIAVWLATYGNEILAVIAPRSYADASRHVVWLAVGLWCFGLLPYRNQHLMLWNRSRAAALPALAALAVNIVVLRVAVPHVGVVGAAVATAAAYGGALLVATWLCRRDHRVDSRLPLRLSVTCLAMSLVTALAMQPAINAAPGRVAQAGALALSGAVLVGVSFMVEGSALKAFRSRRMRGAQCVT